MSKAEMKYVDFNGNPMPTSSNRGTTALESIKATCQSHSIDGCDECEYHNYWDKWDETITCQFNRVPGNWAVEQIVKDDE